MTTLGPKQQGRAEFGLAREGAPQAGLVDPVKKGCPERGMHLGNPVDVDRDFGSFAGIVGRRPLSVAVQPMTRDADHSSDPLGMIERVSNREIRAPRVPEHDPLGNIDGLADGLQVVDRLCHIAGPTLGLRDDARVGEPTSETDRGQ